MVLILYVILVSVFASIFYLLTITKTTIMKGKINIAELLKDCPKGMELDCTMYDNVSFVKVINNWDYPIVIKTKGGFSTKLTKYGQNINIDDAKCVIFPKGKTTWEGFVPPCKFKVGDRVKHKDGYFSGVVTKIYNGCYKIEYDDETVVVINIKEQDEWELVSNKFDITTLKPFDKVLVRDNYQNYWTANLYSHYMKANEDFHFATVFGYYRQCIPYEQNKHLLGTTNDCDDYYKTWKE